jgi:hypothetical protein
VADAYGTLTFFQWAAAGFGGGFTAGAATFTATETAVLVAATHALAFLYTGASYEIGVGIGSLISAIPFGDSTIGEFFGDEAYELFERLQDNQELLAELLRGQCPN